MHFSGQAAGLIGTRLFSALPAILSQSRPPLEAFRAPLSDMSFSTRAVAVLWLLSTSIAFVSFHGTYKLSEAIRPVYSATERLVLWPWLALMWAHLFSDPHKGS